MERGSDKTLQQIEIKCWLLYEWTACDLQKKGRVHQLYEEVAFSFFSKQITHTWKQALDKTVILLWGSLDWLSGQVRMRSMKFIAGTERVNPYPPTTRLGFVCVWEDFKLKWKSANWVMRKNKELGLISPTSSEDFSWWFCCEELTFLYGDCEHRVGWYDPQQWNGRERE